ncbi:MAG: zinc ABC transporter substrate-binding protein [Thermoplasmata archaeon]
MNTKQKIFVIGVAAILLLAILVPVIYVSLKGKEKDSRLLVVASFYPLAFMAQEIGGEEVNVRLLIPENNEVHNWQPKTSDILACEEADILLYNGAGLDSWFEEKIIPSVKKDGKIIVDTTSNATLIGSATPKITRMFVFDNDAGRMMVYEIDNEGHAALLTTFNNISADVLPPFSGHFDNPPLVENAQGYWYLYVPSSNDIAVINTGVHGVHFHDVELITRHQAGMPVHWSLSQDSRYIAYAEDNARKVIVINTSAPGNYKRWDDNATGTSSHATIVFDGAGRLYIADMNTNASYNLIIIDPETGTVLANGSAGASPHGGFYSEALGKVVFNNADGLSLVSPNGSTINFSYSHAGNRLTRSWPYNHGQELVGYVKDSAMGYEYASVVVYNLTTGQLVRMITLNITAPPLSTAGYANSVYYEEKGMVVIGDPVSGKVHLVNAGNGSIASITLNGSFPQSMRVALDPNGDAWVLTKDGNVSMICLEELKLKMTSHLETSPGVNFLLSAISPAGEEEHHHDEGGSGGDDHEHLLHDPHTWVSPFMAIQQGKAIYDALVKARPDSKPYFEQRWNALKAKLEHLDNNYTSQLSRKTLNTIIVSHAAFGYLAYRYNFSQIGVIGISADEQPSISTIASIADIMAEKGIYTIFVDPVYSDEYANTLKTELEKKTGKNVSILKLYLMLGKVDGIDYIGQLEKNLENLKTGLGCS